jgi:hypothetical protein
MRRSIVLGLPLQLGFPGISSLSCLTGFQIEDRYKTLEYFASDLEPVQALQKPVRML